MNSARLSWCVIASTCARFKISLHACCPRLFQLAVLGQRRHVGDGVPDGAQHAAVGRGQRVGELGGEIAGWEGHRDTRNRTLEI